MRTVKVVRVVGGKREEIEIPAGHAEELGISAVPPQPVGVAYLMDALFVAADPVSGESECPHCGTTNKDVLLRHRVGCAHCYDLFADSIDRILQIHRSGHTHPDRIPVRLQRYRRLFMERETLLNELSLAVESEDFETAAELRDRLQTLGDDTGSE
ncbi:MAG: UvrB/UvrC motif-containing protein [Alkalispirochaeta sp.]